MTPWHNLTDGLDADQQRELGDLGGVADQLAAAAGPAPTAADRARLLASLQPLVAARAHPAPEEAAPPRPGAREWLRLVWTQTTLLEPAFWSSSGVVVAIGLLLGLISGGSTLATMFVVGAPVLAAAGVTYLFRPATHSLRELETTYPTRPLELLYARLALILGCNVLLALGLVSVIWLQTPSIVLWRLIIAWLGPMLGLAGLALVTSVRWGGLVGSAAPLIVWVALLALGWRSLSDRLPPGRPLLGEAVMAAISQSNEILWGAVAAFGIGIGLVIYSGRIVAQGQQWTFESRA